LLSRGVMVAVPRGYECPFTYLTTNRLVVGMRVECVNGWGGESAWRVSCWLSTVEASTGHLSNRNVMSVSESDRLCGPAVTVPGCRPKGPRFDSRRYQGPLSLVRINEELLERYSSGSGLEN
jgi:hypothetical protein